MSTLFVDRAGIVRFAPKPPFFAVRCVTTFLLGMVLAWCWLSVGQSLATRYHIGDCLTSLHLADCR